MSPSASNVLRIGKQKDRVAKEKKQKKQKQQGRRERERQRGNPTQRKPTDCSAAKAQALFQTHGHAIHPDLPREGRVGKRRGHTGHKQNTAQDGTETRPHGSKQQSPSPTHQEPWEQLTHPCAHHCAFCRQFQTMVPGFGRVFYSIAQHAHMTQDSSCQALRMSSKNTNAQDPSSKKIPSSHPSLGIPFLHSHLSLLSIRSLKKHCSWLLFGFFWRKSICFWIMPMHF